MVGDATIHLGGQERILRFRLLAWAKLEDRGYPLTEVVERLQVGTLNFKLVLSLLWAGLQHEKPAPTWEEVGEWVGGENFSDVVSRLGEAIKHAFPPGDPTNPPDPVLATAGTGTGSEK